MKVSGQSPLSLSIIIPTKDRPLDLDLAVKSLFGQTVVPSQLIIVDQSLSDESHRRVEERYASASAEIRHTVQLDYIRDTEIAGGAAARNRAMDIAQGDVWVFLDDDVELQSDFLQALVAVYLRFPEVAGVSGVVTNYTSPGWVQRFWTRVFVCGPFHDERQPIYWNANRLSRSEPIRVRKFGAGLMSFRAAAIEGLRFDGNLRGVSDGEDVDFCSRLGPSTILVVAPGARLRHNQSPVGRSQDYWLTRRVRTEWYLYKRNWHAGIKNRMCFIWLNVGYASAAVLASLRRGSLEPWRALKAGVRQARTQSG